MYICVYLYIIYLHIHIIWVFPKNRGKTPQIMNFNRGLEPSYFHHPFWGNGPPIFGETHGAVVTSVVLFMWRPLQVIDFPHAHDTNCDW